jgi:hypothetical protein
VPLVVVEMLELKDVSEPPEIKDLRALLEKRVIWDQLEPSELKVHRVREVVKENLDLRDCPDPKDLLAQLVHLVKREEEVFVENLVNRDLAEKLEAPVWLVLRVSQDVVVVVVKRDPLVMLVSPVLLVDLDPLDPKELKEVLVPSELLVKRELRDPVDLLDPKVLPVSLDPLDPPVLWVL